MRFKFKLASHLGIANPFWLDYILSPKLLNAWAKYYELEPFGADRDEVMMANLTAIIVGMFAKNPPNYEDFMLSKTSKKAKNLKMIREIKLWAGIES